MKKVIVSLTITSIAIMFVAFTPNTPTGKENKFIGSKSCGVCHKSKTGDQDGIWKKSGHATAYENLTSEAGKKIAAANGIEDATKAKECLACHATAAGQEASWDKKFNIEAGVQCEACHGAGSNYKSKKVMLDHAKSVAAGMTDFTKVKPESICKDCHEGAKPKEHSNNKFDFAASWDKIKHPVPEKK